MARITRKQLKSDKFALEVEHTVTFFDEHRTAIVRYGAIALAVIVIVAGYSYYAKRQHNARQAELSKAITTMSAPVGAPASPDVPSFPTQQAKDQQVVKALTDLQKKGHEEGDVAASFLASYYADQGKMGEAEKFYKQAADEASAKYSSLAKLALAQIYFGSARSAEAEKLLRELIKNPTIFVTSDQATLALARGLAQTNPKEARKLADELAKKTGSVGQVATAFRDELPE